MAMAAADPSPAAVMSWPRGLATFPATHTPGTLGGAGGVGHDPALLIEVASEAGQQIAVRHEPRRHEDRSTGDDPAVVQPHTREVVVLDDEPAYGTFDDADGAGHQLRTLSLRQACRPERTGRRRRTTGGRSGHSEPSPDRATRRRAAGRAPPSRGSTGSAAPRVPSGRADPGCRVARRADRSRRARAAPTPRRRLPAGLRSASGRDLTAVDSTRPDGAAIASHLRSPGSQQIGRRHPVTGQEPVQMRGGRITRDP